MLVKITNRCNMGCSHCLSDCKPNGIDMDKETFDQLIKFLKSHRTAIINISGGEPMEHPRFFEMYREIVEALPVSFITVITNGSWIEDNLDTFFRFYEEFKLPNRFWQITRDERYYPKKVSRELLSEVAKQKSNNIFIETNVNYIYPKGRAVDNNITPTANAPSCFNIRSLSNNAETFNDLIYMLSLYNKHCTPSIEPDGRINLGESSLCPACSDIWKSDIEIMQDIRNFKCRNCSDLIDKAVENYGPMIEVIMK